MFFETVQNSDIWLILAFSLMILEIFEGSLVFLIPAGIGALLIGLLYKLQENHSIELFNNWSYALVYWALISLLISFLIQKVFKKKKSNEDDINLY